MSRAPRKPRFASRPGDPENWIKATDTPPTGKTTAEAFTARLTIDITPELRGRIKVAAFRRSGPNLRELHDHFDFDQELRRCQGRYANPREAWACAREKLTNPFHERCDSCLRHVDHVYAQLHDVVGGGLKGVQGLSQILEDDFCLFNDVRRDRGS